MRTKRLKTILIILLFISGLTVSAAAADTKNVFDAYDEALGGFFGELGGSGLTYQHWFGNLGLQTTAGLLYFPADASAYTQSYSADSVNEDIFKYEIGVEAQFRVYEDSYGDWFDGCLYIFAGGKHTGVVRYVHTFEQQLYTPASGDPYYIYPATGTTGPYYVPGIAAGFGFGFETVFFDHFSIPIEFGLGGIWEFSSILPVDAGLKVQGGLRYRF